MRPVFNTARFVTKPGRAGMLAARNAVPSPTFMMDFLVSPNPIIGGGTTTTTIDADGTFVNSSGLITQKTVNVWPLDYDPATLQPRGRPIWEARTNLLLRSAEFDNASWTKIFCTISANSVISPDGTQNADTMVATAIDSVARRAVAKAASPITYSYSQFLKAGTKSWAMLTLFNLAATGSRYWFNLATGVVGSTASIGAGFTNVSASIEPYGNSWYRCTITATSDSAATVEGLFYPADGDLAFSSATSGGVLNLFGADLQAGIPTPYIPTAGASVARAADACSIAFNPGTQGTFVWEGIAFTATTNPVDQVLFELGDGTANERIVVKRNATTGTVMLDVIDGGASQASITTANTMAANTISRVAIAFEANNFALCLNGGAVVTDASGTMPTLTTIYHGHAYDNSLHLNGWERKLAFYPRRVINDRLPNLYP